MVTTGRSRGRGVRMLELRDLVKHYQTAGEETVRAVDGVSLSVAAGEMVALYGPSGSGKTTLLLMVAALLAPTSGKVLVNGRDISSLSEREASHFRLAGNGLRAPELRPAAGRDGDRQHGAEAAEEHAVEGGPPARAAAARAPRARRAPHPPLRDALDGRAPARDDRQGAVDRAEAAARGRAHGQPRHAARARGARAADRALPRTRGGDRARQPRPAGRRLRRPGAGACATANWWTTTPSRGSPPPTPGERARAENAACSARSQGDDEIRKRASPLPRAPACARCCRSALRSSGSPRAWGCCSPRRSPAPACRARWDSSTAGSWAPPSCS